jgi:hypothetical protein
VSHLQKVPEKEPRYPCCLCTEDYSFQERNRLVEFTVPIFSELNVKKPNEFYIIAECEACFAFYGKASFVLQRPFQKDLIYTERVTLGVEFFSERPKSLSAAAPLPLAL